MMDTAHPSGWVWIVDVFRHHADPMGQSTASGGGWARASGTGASRTSATASAASSAASTATAALLAALGPRERGFLQGGKATGLIGDRSIRRIKRSGYSTRIPSNHRDEISFYLLRDRLDFFRKYTEGLPLRGSEREGSEEWEEEEDSKIGWSIFQGEEKN